MLPTSHVLWTSLWLGLASDAVGRARAFVRAEARRTPGTTPPGALRLAETVAELGTMRATVHEGLADYERIQDDPEALAGLAFAIRMNNLKASTAAMAPEIVAARWGSAASAAIATTRRTQSAATSATRTAPRS